MTLNDQKPIDQWSADAQELKDRGVGILAGCEAPRWLLDQIEMVIVSPGVARNKIPVRYAERAGAEVIGEFELASRHLRGRIVAITGTNGKTTTTALTGKILNDAGLPTLVGGNIGVPFISLVDESRDDGWTVVEASSFQLETIRSFHPQVAIALNVTLDHMDRYATLNEYAQAKHRIFMNQQAGDVAILNADDEIVAGWAEGLKAHVVLFSIKHELPEGLFLRGGHEIVSRSRGDEKILVTRLVNREEMQLRGLHNVQNVMAAMAAGLACGVSPDSIYESVKNFAPVEHRLERVAEINGVCFYNDSKATNVDATIKALEAFVE
ncbi:MAG: UDP-N-acetylmuramoyl-L-alanine--D-glutamate ligase, partial [Pyrinomonadaceae bacterium]